MKQHQLNSWIKLGANHLNAACGDKCKDDYPACFNLVTIICPTYKTPILEEMFHIQAGFRHATDEQLQIEVCKSIICHFVLARFMTHLI